MLRSVPKREDSRFIVPFKRQTIHPAVSEVGCSVKPIKVKNLTFASFEKFATWLDNKAKPSMKKDGSFFHAGPLTDTNAKARRAENIGHNYIYIDEQDGGPAIEEVAEVLEGLTFFLYTTYSHSAEHNRYRIILALDRRVKPNELAALHDWLRHFSLSRGLPLTPSHEATTWGRLWYLPRYPEENKSLYASYHGTGGCVCVDAVIKWHREVYPQKTPVVDATKRERGLRTIDLLNDTFEIPDLLELNEYRYVHSCDGGRVLRFSCPYDDATPGVIYFPESRRVYSHHTEVDPLWNEAGQAHDLFSVAQKLWFGGDFDATLKWAKRQLEFDKLALELPDENEDSAEPIKEESQSKLMEKVVADIGSRVHQLVESCPSRPIQALFKEFMATARFCHPQHGLVSILTLGGAIMGNRYRLARGGMMANLQIQIIGPSSSGKNHPLTFIGKVLQLLEMDDMVASNIASAEGMEDLLFRNRGNLTLVIDENMDKMVGNDTNMTKMRAMIRSLLTLESGMYHGRAKAEQAGTPAQRQIKAPFLGLIGGSTIASFAAATKESTLDEGNVSRTIFSVNHTRVPDNIAYRNLQIPKSVHEHAERIRAVHNSLNTNSSAPDVFYEIDLTPEAWDLHQQLMLKETEQFNKTTEARRQQILGRRVERSLRVAMIAATWDEEAWTGWDSLGIDQMPVITRQHLEWAHEVVRVYDRMGATLLANHTTSDSLTQQESRKIARILYEMSTQRKKYIEKTFKSSNNDVGKGYRNSQKKFAAMLKLGYIPRSMLLQQLAGAVNAKRLTEYEENFVDAGALQRFEKVPECEFNGVAYMVTNAIKSFI
jgi:hypothetical protein